jgi:hypothetical protein
MFSGQVLEQGGLGTRGGGGVILLRNWALLNRLEEMVQLEAWGQDLEGRSARAL